MGDSAEFDVPLRGREDGEFRLQGWARATGLQPGRPGLFLAVLLTSDMAATGCRAVIVLEDLLP